MTFALSKKLGAVAGSLVLSAGVMAGPPIINTFTIIDDFVVVECGEFNVRTEAETKIIEKIWFDEYGVPIDIQIQFKILQSKYYNDEFPDVSISQGAKGVGENIMIKIDPLTGEQLNAGAAFRLTIPGVGRVLMDTGNFKLDEDGNIVVHGQNFFLAEGETGLALCEALAF